MKQLLFMLLAFGLLVIGCQEESVSPQKNQVELSVRGAKPRPFKGTVVYYYDEELNAPECDCSGVDGELLPGGYYGSGQMSHMGLTTSEAAYCIVFDGALDCPGPGNRINKLCPTFIAANGDQLFLDFDPFDFCVDIECFCQGYALFHVGITGGTGRFANASGDLTASILADFETGAFSVDFNGTIVY